MSDTYRCGHPKTPENTSRVGDNRTACRQCRLALKTSYRERVRQRALANMKGRPTFKPVALPPELQDNEPLTPEAVGSRNLLIAYARYYEKHVRGEAA